MKQLNIIIMVVLVMAGCNEPETLPSSVENDLQRQDDMNNSTNFFKTDWKHLKYDKDKKELSISLKWNKGKEDLGFKPELIGDIATSRLEGNQEISVVKFKFKRDGKEEVHYMRRDENNQLKFVK